MPFCKIAAALADPKLTLTLDAPPIQAPASPLDPAVTAKLRNVIRDVWGEQPLISDLSTGFSDARRFRAAGMPTYGVDGSGWMRRKTAPMAATSGFRSPPSMRAWNTAIA